MRNLSLGQAPQVVPTTCPTKRCPRGPPKSAGGIILPHRWADEAPLPKAAEGRRARGVHRSPPPAGPTKRRCPTPVPSFRCSRCLPDCASRGRCSNGSFSPYFDTGGGGGGAASSAAAGALRSWPGSGLPLSSLGVAGGAFGAPVFLLSGSGPLPRFAR